MSTVPRSTHPCRVLIVEDYDDMSEALAILLRAAGHSAAVACDVKAALATAHQFGPDVVISDIGLPGEIDGYGLARAFRQDPDLQGSYLVALTAYAYASDAEKARQAGFDEHVAKPAAAELLLEVVERARALHEERSSLRRLRSRNTQPSSPPEP
jgi:CheY-like chemotaxis protein